MPPDPKKECKNDKPGAVKKESEYDKSLRDCAIDAGMKTGASFAIGILSSVFFTKMKFWPVILCTSVGICLSCKNCEKTLAKYKPDPPIPKPKCV